MPRYAVGPLSERTSGSRKWSSPRRRYTVPIYMLSVRCVLPIAGLENRQAILTAHDSTTIVYQ